MVVFSSHSGLGNQSRRLTQMLKPEKILLIDNSGFSKNTVQHPEWYEGFTGLISKGFPSYQAVRQFLQGLTDMYLIENPLNWELIAHARRVGIKTYIAANYEFCDNLKNPMLPLPDYFLMPSHWMVEDMKQRFGEERVKYLPPPIDPNEFKEARQVNLERQGSLKVLHIVGTLAAADRNGTLSILEALQYAKSDFKLVIKSQHELPSEYKTNDPRVFYQIGSEEETQNLYKDFDLMILPRRFGGLCLPMGEALMSGLPVIMTDVSPNNQVLPPKWLIASSKTGTIQTRSLIDLYSADPEQLGRRIDMYEEATHYKTNNILTNAKTQAFQIGYDNFAPSNLRQEYDSLWNT